MIGTTTDMFFKKTKAAFRAAPRPVPNVVSLSVPRDGGSLVMSPDGLRPVAVPPPAAPMPAIHLGQTYVSPDPKRPDVEDVPLGSKANAIQTQGFDAMSTSEERAGGGNPRSAPASLVGGL